MEENKDIGLFFKEKLNKGKKSPNKDMWDKINISLDELAPRKKSYFGHWSAGISVLFLFGLFLLFNASDENPEHSEVPEKHHSNKPPISTIQEALKEDNGNPSEWDSLENGISPRATLAKTTVKEEDSNKNITSIQPISSKKETENSTSEKSSIEETFSITKKYHYYNSEDGKQFTTTNGAIIDSLLPERNKNLDSIPPLQENVPMD